VEERWDKQIITINDSTLKFGRYVASMQNQSNFFGLLKVAICGKQKKV